MLEHNHVLLTSLSGAQQRQATDNRHPSPLIGCFHLTQVKPDDAWSIGVHDVAVVEGRKEVDYKETLVCGAKVLHVYNLFKKRADRPAGAGNDTVTYLWALEDLPDAS